MTHAALLALLRVLPTVGTVPASGNRQAVSSAWRAALHERSAAGASVPVAAASAPVSQSDALTATISRALQSGVAMSAVVDAAAAALGTATSASVAVGVDPAPAIAAFKAAIDPPDPGGSPPPTLSERVRTLVDRLRTVADAAARVSETTTGQQNRFPGNDLDAATAAKANPAPTTSGTTTADASTQLAHRLLTTVRGAIAAAAIAAPVASPGADAASSYVPVSAAPARVSAAPALAALVDALAVPPPSVPATSAQSVAPATVPVVAIPLPSGAVAARVATTRTETGTHVTIAVPDTASRDAVAARADAIVADLGRAGIVADVTVTIDPTLAALAAPPPQAIVAPAPSVLRFAAVSTASRDTSDATNDLAAASGTSRASVPSSEGAVVRSSAPSTPQASVDPSAAVAEPAVPAVAVQAAPTPVAAAPAPAAAVLSAAVVERLVSGDATSGTRTGAPSDGSPIGGNSSVRRSPALVRTDVVTVPTGKAAPAAPPSPATSVASLASGTPRALPTIESLATSTATTPRAAQVGSAAAAPQVSAQPSTFSASVPGLVADPVPLDVSPRTAPIAAPASVTIAPETNVDRPATAPAATGAAQANLGLLADRAATAAAAADGDVPLAAASVESATTPAARAAASAAAPTLLDVATLAATSQPAQPAPPREAAVAALVQAVVQSLARTVDVNTGSSAGGDTLRDPAQQRQNGAPADAANATSVAPQAPALANASVAPAAAPPSLADPYRLVDQLANAVVRATSGHAQTTSEMRVRLSPENLGELSVNVRVDGASVTAQVTTHDAATQAVLANAGDGLAKTLAAAGLRLDGFSVSLAGGQPNDFGKGSTQPHQGRERGRKVSFGTEADDADPTLPVASDQPLVRRPGTLDAFV